MESTDESSLAGEYTNRVVLYLDILGFKQHVYDSVKSSEKRVLIRDTILGFHKIVGMDSKNESVVSESFVSTTFSDLFVCSQSLTNAHAIFHVVGAAIANQQALLKDGFLARGAITMGGLHHDNNGVFGPALIEAYEMESRDAIYPRVILSPRAVELWNQYRSKEVGILFDIDAHYNLMAQRMWLQQDKDDWWSTQYLAYLSGSRPTVAPEFTYGVLDSLRDQIIKLSAQNATSEQHIRAKYYWLRNDWNVAMKKIAEANLSTERYMIEAS